MGKCSRYELIIFRNLELIHIVIGEASKIVKSRCSRKICHKCIGCPAGWVYLTCKDLSQRVKAVLACSRHPQSTFNLRIFIDKSHLQGICPVVDNNHIFKVFAHHFQHIALALAQFQIMSSFRKILILLRIVRIIHTLHIFRKVNVFAASPGKDYKGSV